MILDIPMFQMLIVKMRDLFVPATALIGTLDWWIYGSSVRVV
jgi:hypothetical protein